MSQSLLPKSFTPTVIEKLRNQWTPHELAEVLNMRVLDIEKTNDTTFIELGIIVCEIEKRELWTALGCESFAQWMSNGRNKNSRAKRYAARAAALELVDIAIEDAALMSRSNLKIMSKVPKQHRPKFIEAAKTMEERDLRRKVQKECPEAHVEDTSPMRFKPDRSQRLAIDAAIDGAMLIFDVKTREEALEALAADWLDTNKSELEALSKSKAKAVGA